MKKRISTYLISILLLVSGIAGAQTKFNDIVSLDATVYNFGDVQISDGPVTCSFTVTNISSKPVAILSVVSSCGCTDVTWTKEPLAAGKTGTISATYSNDEGPYPFDKTLTAYVSGITKPIILHLRGNSIQKKEPLDKMYPVHFGNLALKEKEIKIGNLDQGESLTEEVLVANIGKNAIKVDFKNVDPDLSIKVVPSTIPAGSVARMQVTVKANRSKWGKNWYKANPVVGGKSYGALSFWAVTKENFSGMTKAEKDNGSRPMFESSTYSFGKVKAGKKIDASFSLSNKGKQEFKVYKVDCDHEGGTFPAFPTVAAGGKATWKVSFDTTGLPKGDTMIIMTLITNSPNRPLVTLFLTGEIE